MRTFNLRLILWLAGTFLVAAISIHFLHGYQVRKNSGAYLEMAQRKAEDVRTIVTSGKGTQKQFTDTAREAITFYKRYLGLQPEDDLAVRIEYATFLVKDVHDYQTAYAQNERILRATIDPADEELFAKQQEVRETQIALARAFHEYSDGIYHINELLKVRPHDPRLLEQRGVYQLQLDDIAKNNEAARKSLQLAIEYAPDQLTAYARLAAMERERFKNRDAAKQVIEQMVAANPEKAQAYVIRAQFMLGDKNPASQAAVIQKKLLTNATADCTKALELAPKNLDALNILSVCNERLAPLLETPDQQTAMYAKAKQQLMDILALKPEVPSLYNRWSNLELLAGAAAGTDRVMQRAAAIHAIREGVKAVTNPKQNFELRWRLGDLLMTDEGNREEVVALIEQLETEQPDNQLVAYLKGRQLITQQKWRTAAEQFKKLQGSLQKYPELVGRVDMLLGSCYARLGDDYQNLQIAQQAVNRDPSNVEARANLAAALVANNLLYPALKQYEAIVAMRKTSLLYHKKYAELLVQATYRTDRNRRDWGPVLREIQLVGLNSKDDPWVPVMRATVLASTDRLADAEDVLLKAREKDPNEQQFSMALLQLAQQQGDAAKTQQRLKELEDKFGDTIDVRLVKARMLIAQRSAEAMTQIAALTEGLEKYPEKDRLQFYWNLARICFSAGAYEHGLQYGQEAAKLTPQNLPVRLFMLDSARTARNVPVAKQLATEIKKIEGAAPGGGAGAVSLYAQAAVNVTRYTAVMVAAAKRDQEQGDDKNTAIREAEKKNAPLLRQAQQLLDQARKKRTEWPKVPALQGVIAGYLGDQKSEVAYYRQAIDLGDRDPNIVYQVVQALAAEADKGGSETQDVLLEADRFVRKLETQRASLPVNLGRLASRISFAQQKYDRALDLARPLAKTGETRDQLFVGIVAMALGNYAEAEASLREAVKTAPENPKPWRALVRCLLLAGKDTQARATMDEALTKVAPESRVPLHAACLEMLDERGTAVATYRKAIEAKDPSPALLQSAARFFLNVPITPGASSDAPEKRVDPSVRANGQAILERFVSGDLATKEQPPGIEQWARRDLAEVIAGDGYPEFLRALELLDQNLAKNPNSVKDLRLRARLLLQHGQLKQRQEAVRTLQQLADQPGGLDFDSRFLLARQYLLQGHFEKYRDEMFALNSLAAGSPRLPTYMGHFIAALLQHGDKSMAAGVAKKYHQKWPNDIGTTIVLADALAQAGSPKANESLRIIEAAVDDPTVAPIDKLAKMWVAANALDRIAKTLDDRLDQLPKKDPNWEPVTLPESLSELRDLLIKNVKPESARIARLIKKQVEPIDEAAEGYFTTLIEQDPSRTLKVVPHYRRIGKLVEAVDLVLKNWRTAAPATVAEACAELLEPGDLGTIQREDVEKVLKQAVEKYAGTDDVLPLRKALASYLVNANRFAEAIEQYKKIVARRETDIATLNNLSMLMTTQKGEDLALATKYINEALQMVGPNPRLIDSQAMILLADGKTKEALAAIQKVVAEKPERVTAESSPSTAKRWGAYYFHLAMAYQANQAEAKAIAAMKRSKELGFGLDDVFFPELSKFRELVELQKK